MGLIERQLQGVLATIFSEEIKKRGIELAPYATQEEGRADITIKKKKGNEILFFIELKDPSAKDGKTIFDYKIIGRETERAKKLKIEYFGICNFVEASFKHLLDSTKEDYLSEGSLFSRSEIERLRINFNITDAIKARLISVVNFYLDKAEALLFNKQIRYKPVDEVFIYKLKSLIQAHIYSISGAAYDLYTNDRSFKNQIKEYTNKQQWTMPSSLEEIENLTFISVLVLVSKLIFYKSVFDNKSYNISKLNIPEKIKTATELNDFLWQEYFEEFKTATNDFELLIGNKNDIANKIAFLNDEIVDIVKGLIKAENEYDFSKIPYDTIGRIFEELIREDERHKMGQYFTPPDVIDFINSFCIKTGDEKILDPSCGSGTFLVRAYERKKLLTKKPHYALLEEIYGVDLSNYACYLSMLNLASRTFDKPSYPKILNKDFFKAGINGTEKFADFKLKEVENEFKNFDVVIGNPPYTRQKDISAFNEKELQQIQTQVNKNWGLIPSGQSPIYSYFFYRASYLLKEGGYLGFITANSMLDADFGIELQKWMLGNFRIVAIIDSKVERFFPSASVNTCITILQKMKNSAETNEVRFVYLKRKLSDIILEYGDTDGIVNEIMDTYSNTQNENFNINFKSNKELITSSKWSKNLKEPLVYKNIVQKAGDILQQLPSILKQKYGIKTGCVQFFELKDRTNNSDIENNIGAIRNNFRNYKTIKQIKREKLKIVENGLQELWLLEEQFIHPFLTSTKEVEKYTISKNDTVSSVLNVCMVDGYTEEVIVQGKKKTEIDIKKYRNDLKRDFPYLWSYIHWGENNRIKDNIVSQIPSVKGNGPAWWDLNENIKYDVLLLQFRSSRNWTPIFENKVLVSNVFFCGNYLKKKFAPVFNISLNSSFTILETELLGRVNLGEGLLTTYGPDLKELLVISEQISETLFEKFKLLNEKFLGVTVKTIFEAYGTNDIGNIDLKKVDPLVKEIDHLFLEAIGINNKKEREEILIELYASIIDIVNSRITKAESQTTSKTKSKRVTTSLLLQEIDEIISERGLTPKNTIKFGKELTAIIKDLVSVLKEQDKLLQHYWKNKFKVHYNEKEIANEAQIKLF